MSYLCVGVRLPGEPMNVQHKFIVSSSNVSVRLSWSPPSTVSLPPVTGYRVSWGVVMAGSQYLLLDKTTADHRDVPKVWITINDYVLSDD